MTASWIRRVSGAGGGKRGRGRPRDDGGEPVIRVTVMLTQRHIDRAMRVGGENLSLGLRRLLDSGS